MPFAIHSSLPPAHVQAGVFRPIHHESRYAYPLLIWLAGDADTRWPLTQIMPLLSVRNYVAIDASIVREETLQESQCFSHAQFHDDSLTVDRCISTAFDQFNLRQDKVFLVGQDSGGEKAIQLAWQQPHRFAGVISINGGVPRNSNALCSLGTNHRELPLLLQHSSKAIHYSHERFCDDIRLCHTAGLPATFRHYRGERDDLSHILADCNRWLMDLVANNLVQ
jgi:phospholipase/carboxylesterase